VIEWVWSNGGMVLIGETEVLEGNYYSVCVVGEGMGVEEWRNGTDMWKLK